MRIPVKVRNATEPLTINGAVEDALKGEPGVTVGCAISCTGFRHAAALPFPIVAMPQVTSRTILFPTKADKNGLPCEGVMYEHNYRHITDANDAGTLKQMVKENPAMMERSLTFYPPAAQDTHKPGNRNIGLRPKRPTTKRGKVANLRGSALRALKAGLITKPVYDAMKA